jgi:hypothetical protein
MVKNLISGKKEKTDTRMLMIIIKVKSKTRAQRYN